MKNLFGFFIACCIAFFLYNYRNSVSSYTGLCNELSSESLAYLSDESTLSRFYVANVLSSSSPYINWGTEEGRSIDSNGTILHKEILGHLRGKYAGLTTAETELKFSVRKYETGEYKLRYHLYYDSEIISSQIYGFPGMFCNLPDMSNSGY